jgi:hypothetical protein
MQNISGGIERTRCFQLMGANHMEGKISLTAIEAYKMQPSRYVSLLLFFPSLVDEVAFKHSLANVCDVSCCYNC